ncbi:hypothetical protein BKA69DRAFT_1081054 [Paraphysoderma sedebokerense]|nr:hypothetical protein BKA69DRAFT_1081054 [Paraphysoderma sedebokerense]
MAESPDSSSSQGSPTASETKPYPHPFMYGDYGNGAEPKTTLEMNLIQLSASIRSKPNWHIKMKDPEIAAKWKEEALATGKICEKAFEYVMKELEFYESLKDGKIEISNVDGIWQADELIETELREKLMNAVRELENVEDGLKDWHPGSNQQVLDLVHPSLFCLIKGVSKKTDNAIKPVLPFLGAGNILPVPESETEDPNRRRRYWGSDDKYSISKKFQWLPSEFAVSPEGRVTIDSYINNLHPRKHKELYHILAAIFEQFVPLFERVLTDLRNPRPLRIDVDPFGWYESPPEFDNEEDEDAYEEYMVSREPKEPGVPEFEAPPLPKTVVNLRGSQLQVIVKLANIELTPENPKYGGGIWHVEGMKNESIVASGIYYYSSSNISESRLSFRQAIREPDYEQGDNRGVKEVYDLSDEDPLNQELGYIIAQSNRCIAFPNIYQHRVAPFELQDKSKPGSRKILVYFLVDPTQKVLSTANVPPQQMEWFSEELKKIPPFDKLPDETVDHIVTFLDFPINLKTAKIYREELMAERKYFIGKNNEYLFEREFSLCEH